jgi:hypothetical protein
MDLSKLTPAPWHAVQDDIGWLVRCEWDDAEFIALARNAFDVMMRRGWVAVRSNSLKTNPWFVQDENREQLRVLGPEDDDGDETWLYPDWAADPFTALVEAHQWYQDHMSKNRKANKHA